MQNFGSENYKKYVTSIDDIGGKKKAHFFDLLAAMTAGLAPNADRDLVVAEIEKKPSEYFLTIGESINKSVVMATMRKVAAEIGVKG